MPPVNHPRTSFLLPDLQTPGRPMPPVARKLREAFPLSFRSGPIGCTAPTLLLPVHSWPRA